MNKRRKYTKELLEPIVADSDSIADVVRALGLKMSGSTQNLITTRIKEYGLDTAHFTGKAWRRGRTFDYEFKGAEHYLVMLPEGAVRPAAKYLRRAMIESGVEYVCVNGHPPEWMGKTLRLHVDHVDGNNLDNRLKNLRFLCPNCHDQTETWGRQKSA